MNNKFDVLVLGGGPGGYVAAIKAAQLGKKCAIVEKDNLGGVCLNWGCIPTKSLLRNAEIVSQLYKGETFGFSLDVKSIQLDYAKAQQRSREVSTRLVRGIEYLMKKNCITVFNDEAIFNTPKKVLLKKTKEIIEADNIIIATGSRPNLLKGIDFTKDNILDSKKALQLKNVPKSVIIIGAGAIGMEFAVVWKAYGADVTVIEMLSHALPNEDVDISKEVKKLYEKNGIKIITESKVIEVINFDKQNTVKISTPNGEKNINSEYLLVSVGIVPNSDQICIEKTGVKLNSKGYIEVDDAMCTNVNGVYAIGDITGKLALAHVASAQGIVAAMHIAGKETIPINYEKIPKCTYGVPETASVGITEAQAIEKGYTVKKGIFPFSANGKAIAYNEDEGFVKIVADKKYGEILGVHMIGPHVTEMIASAVAYLSLECTLDELSSIIYPHPTMSEAVMEASHVTEGMGIHI